jgi:hypothetical protein
MTDGPLTPRSPGAEVAAPSPRIRLRKEVSRRSAPRTHLVRTEV